MKTKSVIALFSIIFILFSCATAEKVRDNEETGSQAEAGPKPVELKKKRSLAEDIIVRDIYSKEEYPLSKIVDHGIVFIELSASWCKCLASKTLPCFSSSS